MGALGVVFGDIGTSPLYTVQTVFNPNDPHPVRVPAENIYGMAAVARRPGATFLLAIDLLFFAANLTKLVHGAWLPLLIAIAVFTVLTTWQRAANSSPACASRTRGRSRRSSTSCTP